MSAPVNAHEVAIVGAGIAGLSCATALAAAGRRVVLFDKGRRPGGRLATRGGEWGPSSPTPSCPDRGSARRR